MAGEQYNEEHLVEQLTDTLIVNSFFNQPPYPGIEADSEMMEMMKLTIGAFADPIHEHVLSWYGSGGEGGTPPPFIDEKVKMTAGDKSAGYLADKIDGTTIQYNSNNQLFIPPTPVNALWYRGVDLIEGPFLRPNNYGDYIKVGKIREEVLDEGLLIEDVSFKDGEIGLTGGKNIYLNSAKTTRINQINDIVAAVEVRVGGVHVIQWTTTQINYSVPVEGYEARFGYIHEQVVGDGVNVEDINYIDFELENVATHAEGRLHWDDDDKTLEIGTEISNVHLPINQITAVRATNTSGSTMPKGSIVYTTGAQGHRPTIGLAKADHPWTSAGTLGITLHEIPNNNTGHIAIMGLVRGVDTSSCTDGCLIYLSPTVAGGWTDTAPSAPNTRVVIGIVLYAHATEGVILTESATFQNLSGMPDVTLTSLANNHIVYWNATNTRWENTLMPTDTTYTFADSLVNTSGTVNLVGDVDDPGNSKLYGTNSSGTKGWYDIPTSGTPTAHHLTHENDGADEISVAGLSGALADAQTPVAHGLVSAYHTASGLTVGHILTALTATTFGFAAAPDGMVYPDAGIALSTGAAWGTSITNNSADWDEAHGWGDHSGLYDTTGTASGLISTHESTYNHTNYNTAYAHTSLTDNPHSVTYEQLGGTQPNVYWQKNGTVLSPLTDGDSIHTTNEGDIISGGNIAAKGAWSDAGSDAIYLYYSATYGGRIFTRASGAGAYLKTLFGAYNATEGAASINMMADGRVGFLTQSPGQQVDVNGSAVIRETLYVDVLDEYTTDVGIQVNANVGIGVSPQAELDIYGRMRLTDKSSSAPTTGVGMEVFYSGTVDQGIFIAADRDTALTDLKTLRFVGSDFTFDTGINLSVDTARLTIEDSGISIKTISANESETYLVSIDNTTGLLSKRLVSGFESFLGNPPSNDYVLISDTVGNRSWVNPNTLTGDHKVLSHTSDPTAGYLGDKVDGTSLAIDTTLHKMHGRHHVVSNITARDNIPSTQRSIGDTCEVQTTDRGIPETYQLIDGVANSNWTRDNRIMSYSSYYPAIEVEKSSTSLPAATTTSIVVGDISQNISVTVDYVIKRGNAVTKGSVELQNVDNISDPDIHDQRFKGSEVGITFDTHLSGNLIYLEIEVDNSNTSIVDFHYNVFRVMGSISVAVQEFDFYVSDSGDDSKDGLTEANAWETIGKVNSGLGTVITAGDSVGFQRGSIFNDTTLDFTGTSGVLDSPISIGAYGTGDKPVFTGLRTLGDSWTHLGSNTWSYDITSLSAGNIRFLLSDSNDMEVAKSPVRFIYDELISADTISFDATSDEIRDSASGFVTAGFKVGMQVLVGVTSNSANDGVATITSVTAGALGVSDSLYDEDAGATVTIYDRYSMSADTVSFHELGTADEIRDSANGFLASGFLAGDVITVSNAVNSQNNQNYTIISVTAGVIVLGSSDDVVDESAGNMIRFAFASFELIVDIDLGGSDDDYNNSEIVLRSSNYTWEAREVDTSYATGRIEYNHATSYRMGYLTTGCGGYFLQNSRHILEQNTTQGEWAVEGNTLYMYSTTDPFDLAGDIQISVIDTMVDLDDSSYITLDNLAIKYVNQFGVYGVGADYKTITNTDFSGLIWAVWDYTTQLGPIISNNTFTDIFSGVKFSNVTNPTVLSNTFNNVGLDIGINGWINTGSQYWGYNAIELVHPNGGLVQYNNIENVGYCGIKSSYTDGGIEFKNNYVKNAGKRLTDGGHYYTWEVDDVTKTGGIYKDNIAVYDDYTETGYGIGRYDGLMGFSSVAFYKDGYERNIEYDNNFAYGHSALYFSNPGANCKWTNNIGASPKPAKPISTFVKGFELNDYPSYKFSNNEITGNTIVVFHESTMPYWQRVLILEESTTGTDINFNNNNWMQPSGLWYDSNHSIARVSEFSYPDNDKDIEEWRKTDNHGGLDQSNRLTMDISGFTDPMDFMWYAVNPTKSPTDISFPSGYRYYDMDGVEVTSGSLQPYKGKIYFRTIDEGMPQITTPTFTGNAIVGTTLTSVVPSTIYTHEESNSESGSTYQWYMSSYNNVRGRDPISGATSSTYAPLLSDGFDGTKYVILGIIPKSSAGDGSLVVGVERFSTPVLVAESADFYLSGTGSDSAAGTTPETAWATFNKLSAEFLANNIAADSHIALERSNIFNGHSLDTNERDGTSGNEIVLKAYGVGDVPIVKGTKVLSGTWTEETGLGTNIWSFTDASITTDIRHLVVGGSRKPMGQTSPTYFTSKVEMLDATTLTFNDNSPSNDTIVDSASGFIAAGFRAGDRLYVRGTTNNNTDYLDVLSVTAGTITVNSDETLTDESPAECDLRSKSSFKDTLLGGSDDDWVGGEIVYRSSQWVEEVEKIDIYEAASGLIHWSTPSSYYPLSSISTHKYLIQNHWRTLLSAHTPSQGDWAYDSVTDKIYMYSTSEPSTLGTIEISIVDRLVDLTNSHYFKFEDIEFRWNNSRAILAENSTYIEVDSCTFAGGSRGVDFWGNSTNGDNNKITNSEFKDLTHNGVAYFKQNNAYTVDNTFLNIGTILGGKTGETLSYSQLNSWSRNGLDHNNIYGFSTVQYNHFENIGYCGIKMTNTPNQGFLIDKNYVKNALYTLSDGGGIYLVSTFDGNSNDRDITNNLLEFEYNKSLDLYESSYKAHGIYSDRQNDDINFQGNFVMKYLHGMNLSYADNQDNIVQDNVVWSGPTAAGDAIHTRPGAFSLSHAPNSWGDTTNNEIKNNVLITTYSPTLQDSMSSTFHSDNSDSPVDWGDYDNDFSGNHHMGLSGNLNRAIPEGTVWLKTVDWPYDSLSVDKFKDELKDHDPVGATELGWVPISYGMSGLSGVGIGPHDQPYYDMNPTKSSRALSLPSGYRYFDTDGARVTSGTLDSYKGKFLIRTIDEGMPEFGSISFTGTAEVGNVQTAPSKTSIYTHEESNTESGSEYKWYICSADNIKTRRQLKRIEADTISFSNADPDTISDSDNNFLNRGFIAGDVISIRGSDDNDGTSYTIDTVTASTITLVSGNTLNNDTAGDLIIIEVTSQSTITPTTIMGFTGTEYLALGMKPKSASGDGALVEGIERFSSPKLMGVTALQVVGRVIFNGDAGDVRGANTYPALGKYNNSMIGVNTSARGVSTNYAHSGTRSIYLNSDSAGTVTYRANAWAAAAQLYADIKYRVTFWYYLPSTEDYTGNILVKTDGSANGVQTWATQSLVTNTWTKVECDLYYEGDETQVLDIEVTAGGAGELIYFDDLEMGALISSLSSTEQVTNGDCETALPTVNGYSWTHYHCSSVRSSDEAYAGTYSCKVTNTESNLALVEHLGPNNTNAELTAGWYRIAFRIYAPDTPNDWRLSDIGISHVKADGTWYNWGLGNFSPLAEWELQECVAYIETAHDYIMVGRLYDEVAAGGGVIYLDDFSIKAVTLPTI